MDFYDGTKEFEKFTLESITTWCKHWDTDNFSSEYKRVNNRRAHKNVTPPATANQAGTKKGTDPPGTISFSADTSPLLWTELVIDCVSWGQVSRSVAD